MAHHSHAEDPRYPDEQEVSARSSFEERERRESEETIGDKEKQNDTEKVTEVAPDGNTFPDGGFKAWLVLAGCASGSCGTFGLVNGWGVFQEYYATNILTGRSPSDIAWIGSVQYAMVFLPGLVIGRLFDMGWFKVPLGVACTLCVVFCFLTAECTQYWQFLLCQGFAVGLMCGVIFNGLITVPSQWFRRNLGLALGIMAQGSSAGGIAFPIATRNLINAVGFKWTMRIMGFIELALLGFCYAVVRRRLPTKPRRGPFFDWRVFKSLPFTLYVLSSVTTFFGLYTILTYVDSAATFVGHSPDLTFYLVAIANGGSAVGRMLGGLLSDRTGNLNIMIPATLLAGVITYIWPFVTSFGGIVAIAIFYGMGCGMFVSLMTAPIVRMGDVENAGARIGITMTVTTLGAVAGPPISGAINAATGGYTYVGVYAGSAVMVCVALLLATRYLLLGKKWLGKI